jgi:hypothetical protein
MIVRLGLAHLHQVDDDQDHNQERGESDEDVHGLEPTPSP